MSAASRVVFVLMDGARADVFRYLLGRGDLPVLARHVIEPGCLRVGTTVFPSTTGVAYIPFLFGRFPGTGNVPGVRWLDRAAAAGSWRDQWRAARSYCGTQAGWIDTDIAPAEGMFSLVPESIAISSPITRGLRPGAHLIPLRRAVLGTLAHFVGCYGAFDDAVAQAWLGVAAQPWRFLFVVFPGIDGLAHLTDPWHSKVLGAYRRVDRALGAFLARAAKSGERPLIVVSADHGFSAVREHWDVAEHLEGIGIPTVRHPVHVWRRAAKAAVMVSGNACAHLYLEPRSGRSAPCTGSELPAELLAWLRAQPAVELVAWRDDDGGVLVSRADNLARLAELGREIAYLPLSGDPLGLGQRALRLEDRGMLLRSRATPYPDAPRQLLQLFRSPRAGDVVLAAAGGFDFRGRWEVPEHRGGHGSLVRAHMEVPIATTVRLGGAPLRTVDLMPLMAEHLGVAVPEGTDGILPRRLDLDEREAA